MTLAEAHSRKNQILTFFEYTHLPPHLQAVSKPFCDLATALTSNGTYPDEELLMGLRKLLEAKDCCVRSVVWKDQQGERHSRLVPDDRDPKMGQPNHETQRRRQD
jgi:hypothetical protein